MTLKQYAAQLAQRSYAHAKKYSRDEEYVLDPITILTIITIIMKLVEYILAWYNSRLKSAEAIKYEKLGLVKRWLLWRVVRKNAKSKKQATYIYRSLITLSKELTDEERITLFSLS